MRGVFISIIVLAMSQLQGVCAEISANSIMSIDSSSDTIRIGVGDNKQVEFILDEKGDIEMLDKTDINSLVKYTYKMEVPLDKDITSMEIKFDEAGKTKMIIEADDAATFADLITLDFNKMIDITQGQLKSKTTKESKHIVVESLKVKEFMERENQETISDAVKRFRAAEPLYAPKTVVNNDEIEVVDSRYLDGYSVGDRRAKMEPYTHGGFVFGLGVNNWIESSPKVDSDLHDVKWWGSWNTGLYYSYTHHLNPLHRSSFGFSYMLGVDWYNFKFSDRDVRVSDTDRRFYEDLLTEGDSKKSKLTVTYLSLYIMPEIYLSKYKCLSIGGYGGVNIGAKSKTKVKNAPGANKQKDKSIDGITEYRYGVRAEFGGRFTSIYATYDFNEVFDDSYSPNLHPFTVGVVLKFNKGLRLK